MKSANFLLSLVTAGALAALLGAMPAPARAAQTDLSQTPLGTSATANVLPNLMFILDDSGSMNRDHMPDEIADGTSCKKCDAASGSCLVAATACQAGYPPYYAAAFNTVYYNPNITYTPGVKSDGTSWGNATPTDARSNGFDTGSGTTNLTTGWREVAWCDTDWRSGSELTGGSVCKRNGVHTPAAGWRYNKTDTNGNGGYPVTTGTTGTSFRFPIAFNTAAHYYNITPREFCTDARLQTCSATQNSTFTVPAPVRWCKSEADAASTSTVSDSGTVTSPKCQSKANSGLGYIYPRFGTFRRVNIVSSTANYPKVAARTDCTGAVGPNGCSYAQEIQNFANWYSYYRTRMLMMKTTTGHAFTPIDDRYRVGLVTINVANDTSRYVKIEKFDATQRSTWYNKLYSMTGGGGTPLRQALSRVGRHFAGMTDGINDMMPDDPVQFSCQQNFALLTTDGYWNGAGGVRLDGTTAMGNQDNVEDTVKPFYVKRAGWGTYDGNLSGTAGSSAGSADTLADVAMYYYKNDLRPAMKDNVPTTEDKYVAPHQHMVTFTLGLGLDGLMTYQKDYETSSTGDFARIKAGNPSGCPWVTGTCNWPQAKQDDPAALDDLWHAAVNGRGKYFSAKEPKELKDGLAAALAAIQITTGTAAASATSTPNITPTDNFIFSATYRTVKWDGEVVAEKIDTATGAVIPGVVWAAGAQLDGRVSAASDTRTIYTFEPGPKNREDFLYSKLTSAQQANFTNKGTLLPQYPTLSAADQTSANSGTNLVNWLRGWTQHEGTLYRDREHVLGDVVNAKPVHVAEPDLQYGDATSPTYSAFKVTNASRQPVLYIAANDGMLHAFDAATGAEKWAWVPRMIYPDMYKLASTTYDISHRYYVDGSPVVMDVFFKNAGKWKTILVGGLNAGGRGYYAIDVTDPNDPQGLWEFCADPTGKLECTAKDDNLGYTFGQPIITKDAKDGNWVVMVSSGYNNVSPGDGKGHIFILDAETGTLLDQKDTNVGDTSTPSGFAKITGFATNFMVNNTTTIVYGGDLLGNMFSFDVANRQFQVIGQARDGTGKIQSITTRPDVTRFDAPAPAFNVVYFGTGRLLGASDIPDPMTLVPPAASQAYQQSVYGIKDTGTNLGNLHAGAAKLVQQTLSILDANTRTVSNNAVDFATSNGWYVDLNPSNDTPGERVNIDPQLVRGSLIVAANQPNNEACSAGGDSFIYQFDYRSGSYIASAPSQVVGVKLGSALTAGFVVYRLPSGQLKYTGIDVTGKKKTEGVNPGGGGALGNRVSWRELYQ